MRHCLLATRPEGLASRTRGSQESQGRATIDPRHTPSPGQPGPLRAEVLSCSATAFAPREPFDPGMEREGTAVQPDGRGGVAPGEEAEEQERLWAAPAGGFYLARGKRGVASVTAALENF